MRPLTVGMATYRDFDGVYFTVQSLRAHHGDGFDLVVVDNAPERCGRTEAVTRAAGGRYFHRPDLTGTSKPRDAVFRYADTPWALVCDSHVLFEPHAISALEGWAAGRPDSADIVSGPLVADDGRGLFTHWRPTAPLGLWGVWDVDPRGTDPDAAPFEIPMQGLGAFAARTAAWPGFHPLARGFGGEEGYTHEVFRRRGGRALCLPRLRWRHRFRDLGGWADNPTPYPALATDHVWNLLVQHRELGIDARDRIRTDFGRNVADADWQRLVRAAEAAQPWAAPAPAPTPTRLLGVWYSDNTAPPALLSRALASVRAAADWSARCGRHPPAAVSTVAWEPVPDNPFPFARYSGERKRSHGALLGAIRQAMEGAGGPCDVVCFLEHDVLYPADYFVRVADAFGRNPAAPVVSNLDYIGVDARGWQPVRERHEPMHQLSMRWPVAVANRERALAEWRATGSALVEPQGDRAAWVRLPAAPGLGLMPAVHVNHTAGRFTAHGEVVYGPAAAVRHPHWGAHRAVWPGEVGPAPVAGGGEGAEHPTVDAWFRAARSRPSDFHEHMDTLRALADGCGAAAEVGAWNKPSLVALCASTAKRVYSFVQGARTAWPRLKELCGDRLATGPVPDALPVVDLLVIDTAHNAATLAGQLAAFAPAVARYLVVHCTVTFGENGDDGGPGVLPALREWCRRHPAWVTVRDDKNNHGLMVLSRRPEDRVRRPAAPETP